ncbi:MAG: DMT family transporter [Brevibacterium sp.]|nr:DMT family transporter [Brevibacterium sp.]
MKSPAALLRVRFAGLVTITAGGAMSLQGRANGLLGPILGHSVFAALVSFFVGLLLVGTTLLCSSRSRSGARSLSRLARTQAMPWWILLGGLSGGLVVIAQASTVPIMGVAMFTMAFVSGQVTGGLAVDSTRLPPGGKQRPTVLRVFGVLVVIAALVYGASERLNLGVPLWALLLPFVSGALTSVQQAFNGRIKAATGSVIVATTVNFAIGFLALLVAAGIIMVSGVTWAGFPTEPTQWWMLLGGVFGVIFIGLTALTVAKLGVLLLSLFSLFGNLLGALLLDLRLPMPGSLVSTTTIISAALVLAGIAITIMPSSGNRLTPSPRT